MEALQEAGWPAYVTIAIAMLATLLALGAAGAAFGKQRSAGIGLSIGGLVLAVAAAGMGALGYAIQMSSAFEAVAYADPSSRATMLAQGISEAMNNVVIGGVCAAPAFLVSFGALVVTAMRGRDGARARGD